MRLLMPSELESNFIRRDFYGWDSDGNPRTRGVLVCCGDELLCTGFTNTCPHCGDDYNMSGDLLAPRDQWGEETGESVADILAADVNPWVDE